MFTIVIATCGRPERLACGLARLEEAIAATGEIQRVVVVDNGPGYPAQDVALAAPPRVAAGLSYVQSEPRNKAKALNAGIAAARTEWLAFTDDDTLVAADWLARGAGYARGGLFRVFGGRVIPGQVDRPMPAWLTPGRSGRIPSVGVYVAYDPCPSSGPIAANQAAPFGANLFVRRDVFADRGGYDEALWALCRGWPLGVEDSEFGHRLKRAGEPIGYCREAVVIHPVNYDRCSLREHFRRAYYDGWRQPLVFIEERRRAFEPFRIRMAAGRAIRAAADLLRGDPAGAADHAVEMVRTGGAIAGRLSRAYAARCRWPDRRSENASHIGVQR